jgi:hypothetical protein
LKQLLASFLILGTGIELVLQAPEQPAECAAACTRLGALALLREMC